MLLAKKAAATSWEAPTSQEDIGESQGNRFVSVCGNGCRERDAVLVVHLKAPAWQSQTPQVAPVLLTFA